VVPADVAGVVAGVVAGGVAGVVAAGVAAVGVDARGAGVLVGSGTEGVDDVEGVDATEPGAAVGAVGVDAATDR
jgi:hypothetical protein